MITYTKQEDGTFLKAGEFAAAPAEVLIQIGDAKPFSGSYTLAQAQQIIEDAIAKGQVKRDKYAILPVPEKVGKVKTPKAPKEPKAPKPPKEKKPPKYDVQQFATIYQNTKSLEDVCKATGASRAYAHRALVKLGLYEKPVAAVKPAVVLEEAEEARVQEIIAGQLAVDGGVADRKAAIKQLRKEQRAAKKAANAQPKKARVLKYSVAQFQEIYQSTSDVNQVVLATGASKVYVIRALTKLGVYQKPAKAVPASTEAPVVETPAAPATETAPAETPAPAAKKRKSAPQQEQPPVESSPAPAAKGKKGKK